MKGSDFALLLCYRKYAKRLAEIAGDVGEARLRDDVAKSVASYVKLVSGLQAVLDCRMVLTPLNPEPTKMIDVERHVSL